ncbi:tyrosine-type recombinase/integrase [Burkholderia ubonensis]|uniref:tyrosine-type recombinase/integrase n=1 Tax=Burkholderia ubonensis TaxID=101571 RepID=UPI001E2D7424|nr:tyrosine-type recombinase/integrase [Burkholderia ubonensis]
MAWSGAKSANSGQYRTGRRGSRHPSSQSRQLPLWKETAVEIRRWIEFAGLQETQSLLPNRWGKPMTRSNVAERIARAVSTATAQCASLRGRTISPHTLRHTTAMHLLQSGVDLTGSLRFGSGTRVR